MKLAATIRGVSSLEKKLAALDLRPGFVRALRESAILIHATAVKSIQAHESQGRTYRRGSTVHIASKPGHPPNTDTGRLVRSIKWEIDEAGLRARVGTDLDYGRDLEVKRDRPWLQPAYRKNRQEIRKLFGAVRAKTR